MYQELRDKLEDMVSGQRLEDEPCEKCGNKSYRLQAICPPSTYYNELFFSPMLNMPANWLLYKICIKCGNKIFVKQEECHGHRHK